MRRIRHILTGALLLAMALLAVIALRSGHEVVTRLDEYQAARTEYADLRERFGVPIRPADDVDEAVDAADTPESAIPGTTEDAMPDTTETGGIDFDALRSINPNVVGWIVVPGTSISYPVVQGADNCHYLRHTFTGERNASGTIFLDYRNRADFSDSQMILHGHNMRDGSMFAPLHGWTGNRFIIYTPDGVLEFEVFRRRTVGARDEIFQLNDMEAGARVVTLSTCVNGRPNQRFVTLGQQIEA